MPQESCWELIRQLEAIEPQNAKSIPLYERFLTQKLMGECDRNINFKPLTEGCQAMARYHLGRAYAFYKSQWRLARKQIEIALQLAPNAVFYSYPQSILNHEEIINSIRIAAAIVEHCGFNRSSTALGILKLINSGIHLDRARLVSARILLECGKGEQAKPLFLKVGAANMKGKNLGAFVAYLERRSLAKDLMLSAHDLYE